MFRMPPRSWLRGMSEFVQRAATASHPSLLLLRTLAAHPSTLTALSRPTPPLPPLQPTRTPQPLGSPPTVTAISTSSPSTRRAMIKTVLFPIPLSVPHINLSAMAAATAPARPRLDAVTGEDDEESAGMDFEAFLALARGETGADEDETAIFSIGARTGVTKATYSHRSRLLVSRWRPEDDRQLLAAVALHGTDLALVQKKLPTRTRTQIKRRLAILSKTTPHLVRNAILASLGVAGGDAVVRPDGTVVPMIPPHGITPQITPLATASATDRLASAAVLDATRALIAQADAESAVRNAEEAAENAGAEAQARALFGQAEAEAEVMALFGLAPEAGEEAEGAPAPPQELANTPVDAPVTGFEDLYDPEMFGGEIDLYGMDDDM
eukprot:gnl/Ergobibamus_cyprinoides/815.p1 GENE.gnl/Ergobibamus_cyprinoides/815~~gnl/Ergobibamus_cyprinoides/815.p1  ORF type:complete len:382 (+),score=74.37 gnl/Ergobibamus_cyprinoides/815:148-1293(+)